MLNKYLTDEQIKEYDQIIDESEIIPFYMKNNPIGRNVCRCGVWLGEELVALDCPDLLISSITCDAGFKSFEPVKKLLISNNIDMINEEFMLKQLYNNLTDSQYEDLLKDIWNVYSKSLEDYKNNKLDFDTEPDAVLN